jgi:hypothetical protein
MKRFNALLLVLAALLVCAALAVAGTAASKKAKPAPATEQPGWDMPIAAGVWYPQDGPLPDKPMRYYRARCWPGCHVGSSFGMYPDEPLEGDSPIHMTSTINNLPPGHPAIKK